MQTNVLDVSILKQTVSFLRQQKLDIDEIVNIILKNFNKKKDEINIENFGFSYCLTKTKDKVLLSESSLAMGGYFQEGAYEEPAYKKALLHKPISKGLFHNIILK